MLTSITEISIRLWTAMWVVGIIFLSVFIALLIIMLVKNHETRKIIEALLDASDKMSELDKGKLKDKLRDGTTPPKY